jgi:Arc/MetJ family transcription regulator
MAKTTVVIEDELLSEAMQVSGARTKRQAITTALKELIRRKNLEALRDEAGTYDLALSPEELEKLRDEQ